MKEHLDSDRVNYLVWRYLLESNYRETAAKLQKEWRIQAPHREFEFAPHVKNYALVDVLNKGLVYQSLEWDFAQSQRPGDAATAAAGDRRGVFGPVVPQPPVNYAQLQDEDEEPLPNPVTAVVDHADKPQPQPQSHLQPQLNAQHSHQQGQPSLKRQVESPGQLANGNPPKRPRLANANGASLPNGVESATSPVDPDHHQSDNHAYPSPLEGEQAPTPAPRTEGPDHATQTDKIDELEPRTIYLRLAQDVASAATTTFADEVSHRPTKSPVLLQCEWNPIDPSRLAAAGTDALARVWTVSRATIPEQVAGHVDPGWPSINLVDEEFPPNSKITAFSWAPDGKHIAVATDDDQKARIDLWNLDGKQVHHWDDFEGPIVKLRCNPLNRSILSISPSTIKTPPDQSDSWVITLLPSISASPVEFQLMGHDLDTDEPDVAWMNESEFMLCMRTKLIQLRLSGDSIIQVKEFATREQDPLTSIQYDPLTGCIAAATSSGHIDIWESSGERRSNDAPVHDGHISVLQWQPSQVSQPNGERLLASGGEDGTIIIRDARQLDSKAKLEMTIDANPVLALAFTPDGAFLAGATRDKILIWKVGEYTLPRAQWSRTNQPGVRFSPKVNGTNSTADVEDQHCLCWDASGQRLAFGVNDLLAVINFR